MQQTEDILKHQKYTKIWDNTYSDDDDAKKKKKNKRNILILGTNTIQNHRGPQKTCKILSLKIPVSACHVTGNTWYVNSCPDVADIDRIATAKNSKDSPV